VLECHRLFVPAADDLQEDVPAISRFFVCTLWRRRLQQGNPQMNMAHGENWFDFGVELASRLQQSHRI
jgi:hypothetical protein